MKQLFVVVSHNVDADFTTHSLVGAYSTLKTAVAQMREIIYNEFEDIKEWWEDDDEQSVEEQYTEWIEENYVDEEHLQWSYTDDDPVEHLFKIQSVEVENCCGEIYALLCTRVDGADNQTDVLGVYTSQDTADKALEALETNNAEDDTYLEVTASVEKITIE
ncbi:MAG: hypothetical protein E7143_07275 [Rikenellaceae bacterium]|nr:hypothetical protein [Rikenellaceae bacterium]